MKVAIRYDPPFVGMAVWIYEDKPDGRYVVKPIDLEMERLDIRVETNPTLSMDEGAGFEFLNSLADALVKAGFKPDELKARDKELESTRRHLEDMRSIVFKKLNMPKP